MIKKVIYIGYQPLTPKFYSDYYIETCLEKQLEVEYWNLSNIYFPKIDFPISLDFTHTKNIKSYDELKEFLSSVEKKTTVIVTNITYEYRVLRLFYILSVYNCTLIAFGRGMLPIPEKQISTKILEIFSTFDLNRIVTVLKNTVAIMFKRFNIIKPYDLVFTSGSEGYNTLGVGCFYDIKNAKIIQVNYFDYDKYLGSISQFPLINKKYCVFLDEYLPYHPDFEMLGIKTINPYSYYSQLNSFFDFIENRFNICVIIAAHPKAHKYNFENPFNGRSIYFDLTCELVRDAAFTMMHYSSSISYTILFKKPILLLTSQSQQKTMPHLHKLILHIGKFLKSQVIHFDNLNNIDELNFLIDFESYDNYKYKYLTSEESEKRQSSEIFIDAILQL